MTARTYTPMRGSTAERLIAYLRDAEPGTTLTSPQIADMFGIIPASVSTVLRRTVEAGALAAQRVGKTHTYSLPAAPPPEDDEPTDGRLKLCHYSTGEVCFSGALINGNTVELSAEQLQQLVDFVTTPHLAHRPAAS